MVKTTNCWPDLKELITLKWFEQMEVEVKMNSKVYHDLVQEAIDTAIERTLDAVEKNAKRLNFFTNEEVMKILGYKNKESLKRRLKESHIPYRTLGKNFFVTVEDMNAFIEQGGKLYGL